MSKLSEYVNERKKVRARRIRREDDEYSRRRSALEEDMNDYDLYNSPGGKRALPHERQREMELAKVRQPENRMMADADTAWKRYRKQKMQKERAKKW